MKKLFRPLFSLLFVSSLLFSLQGKANHTVAMELDYRHVSGNRYELTLTYYRNCLGGVASAPPSLKIGMKTDSLDIDIPHFTTLPLTPVAGAPPLQHVHNCSTQPLCYEEYIYRGMINITHIAPDLRFYAEYCCLPSELVNVPKFQSFYVECRINTLDFPHGNDSPMWHTRAPNRSGHTSASDIVMNYPVRTVCANKEVKLFQDVIEYQGDQIKYEFIVPMVPGGGSVTYAAGYDLANPFPFYTPPGLEIDSNTGVISLKADTAASPNSGVAMYLIAIKATEYATVAGIQKEKGSVIRYLMIIVEPEASCPGSDFAMQDSTLVLECGDSTISVAVNTQFNCYTADADASFIELTDSTTGNPVAINDVSVNNCWQGLLSSDFEINLASPLSPGTYYLTMVDGTDGNTIQSECGYFIDPRQDTIVITVPDVPEAQLQSSVDTSTGQPLGYLAARCGEQALTITLDAPVWCSSIDSAASEWIVVDSSGPIPFVHPIQNVTYTCLHGQTAELTLHFSLPLEEGIYWLHLQDGTDNNTIVNKCNIATLPTTMLLFADNFKVALGPDIEYCKNTNFFKFLKAGPGTSYLWSTGDTTQELLIDTQGVYSVTVMNELGCSAMDTVIVTEIDCSTGIGETKGMQFSIYPNPSAGILYIQGKLSTPNLEVEVRDLNGKSVLQTTATMKAGKPTALQLQALPKGMYFVELRTTDYNEVMKVMLQ